MCKCCQSCLESWYWHCCEKWFCYDENIALYEDPLASEKDRRSFDNIAFWDSVAVIANRSVVTIQPLPEKSKINSELVRNNNVEESEEVFKESSESQNGAINVVDSSVKMDKVKMRKQSTIEDKIEKQNGANSQEKNRKKSLKDRRKSAAGLTLKLEPNFHEIPIIRQSSVPRFFLDTPEVEMHGNYSGERSSVLVSPMINNSPSFNYDLKSIVQIENEISQSKPTTPKSNRSSRLSQVRKKIKPIIIKKPSSKSLPDSVNHI